MKHRITNIALAITLAGACSLTAMAANTFTDVSSASWYYEDVTAMTQQGTITGYADGTFKPNAPVTYGEFASLITKEFLGVELDKQLNTPCNYWWEPYMTTMEEAHIWEVQDSQVADIAIVRQDVFSAISILMLQESQTEIFADGIDPFSHHEPWHIALLLETGIVQGSPDGNLHLKDTITRAEMATILSRLGRSGYLEISLYEPKEPAYAVSIGEGSYDRNRYTVPADFNLDGVLTESEVLQMLSQLQAKFPHGSHLEDAIYPSAGYLPQGTPGYILKDEGIYYKSDVLGPGGDCIAWAYYISDSIYGNLPATYLLPGQWTEGDLRPGDVVDSPTHDDISLSHAHTFSNGTYGYYSTDTGSHHIIMWLTPEQGRSVGLSLDKETITIATRYPK